MGTYGYPKLDSLGQTHFLVSSFILIEPLIDNLVY
jgi:hypothetical protein